MEISQDQIISKMILKEEPVYLASGKKSKRTKIPFMDVWKKYKDGLKQCGFGLFKTSLDSSSVLYPFSPSFFASSFSQSEKEKSEKEKSEKEKSGNESEKEGEEYWIVFFKTRNLINNSSSLCEKKKNEEDHINIRNKYYEFFCKAN